MQWSDLSTQDTGARQLTGWFLNLVVSCSPPHVIPSTDFGIGAIMSRTQTYVAALQTRQRQIFESLLCLICATRKCWRFLL